MSVGVKNDMPLRSSRSHQAQFEGGYTHDSDEDMQFEGGNGQRRRTNSRNPDVADQQYHGQDSARGLVNDQPYSQRGPGPNQQQRNSRTKSRKQRDY